MKIEGSNVLVTGAASGIGRTLAIEFARKGGRMFLLTGKNSKGLQETVKTITDEGNTVSLFELADITNHAAIKKISTKIHKKFGPIDILINNAGISLQGQVEDMKITDWKKVIDVNLWGVINCIDLFVPEMIKSKKGHIINMASSAGIMALPWHAAYSASKYAVVGISEVLKYDLKKHNIGVSVVCPGIVKTEITKKTDILGVDKKLLETIKKSAKPMGVPVEFLVQKIIKGMNKNKFMIITPFNFKVFYFLKRHLNPLYESFIKGYCKQVDKLFGKK